MGKRIPPRYGAGETAADPRQRIEADSCTFMGTGPVTDEALRRATDVAWWLLDEPQPVHVAPDFTVMKPISVESRAERYAHLASLIEVWLEDDSGYDERTWPLLEKELRDNPIRFRE